MAYIDREQVCENCNNKNYCEKEKCPVYKVSTADVVPKSEVVTELFADLEKILCLCDKDGCLKVTALYSDYAEFKKKYTEGKI